MIVYKIVANGIELTSPGVPEGRPRAIPAARVAVSAKGAVEAGV